MNALTLADPLGSQRFIQRYGLRHAYQAGAMANGISSAELVIALGKSGYLGSFGAGGLSPDAVEQAIQQVQAALPNGPYLFNLLHSPDPGVEDRLVALYLKYGVTALEASAFVVPTSSLVHYRAAGIVEDAEGQFVARHRVIAKISRAEVAEKFMRPPGKSQLDRLVQQGRITQRQADLAATLPVATDITVEADSGGHTDNQSLTCLFPIIHKLAQRIQAEQGYAEPLNIGAAGGIGTPAAAAAAFILGADYVVTGSINQAAVEARTSAYVKALLAQTGINDVAMCPSADMFEMGAQVQVARNGSLYPFRAQKLQQLYQRHESLEEIPAHDMEAIEKSIFQKPWEDVWADTQAFFQRHSPEQIAKAQKNPKLKMALVFRWYLGQSSRWAIDDHAACRKDYQIWCGPSMGAFNDDVRDTPLARLENRSVTAIADRVMQGAASILRRFAGRDEGTSMSDESLLVEQKPLGKNSQPATKELCFDRSIRSYESGKERLAGGLHYNWGGGYLENLVIPFTRGKGARVWDMDGNEHLDLFCKFGAMIVGHANPVYNEALKKNLEMINSVDNCGLENEVCGRLSQLIPCAEMMRFGLSGSESVQNALRLARAYTGRTRFVRFTNHYHGNGDGILGGRPVNPAYPVPEPFNDYKSLDPWACQIQKGQSFVINWNDAAALKTLVENHGHEISAVLMEPICFNGGGILPAPGYLQEVRDLCTAHNILLIFDEVITGLRFTLGGAQSLLGVTPDLAIFGKALGGGALPVSLIAGRKDILSLYAKAQLPHLGTFNGYPLGLAAVAATLQALSETGCYERMGRHLMDIGNSLVEAAQQVDLPMVVQGLPQALVFHVCESPIEQTHDMSEQQSLRDVVVRNSCRKYGIQFSPLSRIYSNLMLTAEDVQFFKERIGQALSDAKKQLREYGLLLT